MPRRTIRLSEEIITMLSNLGAIEEDKAVEFEVLKSSEHLKNRVLDEELLRLVESGYVKRVDGKLYLTKVGLLRALSRFS